MTRKILVVDDDHKIRTLLKDYLERNNFAVLSAADGAGALAEFERFVDRIALIVLDVMLPDQDGFSLCQAIRRRSDVPVLMLTASADDTDRIVGLEIGADDYLGKPFNPRELLARIKAILRRVDAGEGDGAVRGYRFDDFSLDVIERYLKGPDGAVIHLSGQEFQLLQYLVEHAGEIVERAQLAEATGSREPSPLDRYLDVQISRLRQRLGDDGRQPRLIKTVRGAGYVFAAEVAAERG